MDDRAIGASLPASGGAVTARVVTTAYGIAALDALRTAVGEVKRDDPMAPVMVIAPSNIAGIVARRHLAHGVAGRPGVAGIEVTTLARLAERLASPVLAQRKPATQVITAAAWRRALANRPGVFAGIAEHPATVRALVEAHRELRDVGAGGLDAVRSATAVSADLVALHRQVTDRLADGWYDTTDVLTVAAGRLATDGTRTTLGSCLLYLPQALSQAESRFARAIADQGYLTVIAGLTGAIRADEAVHRSLARLGASAADAPPIATATRILTASDSDDEVRCIVRDVVDTLRTTPAHRVAVLYAARLPYARMLHEQLAHAQITANGAGVRPADERAVARTLLEVLRLADRDVPRAALFQGLANAPARDFTGERIPISRWERLSRAAGVVAGDDWSARMDAYIEDRLNDAAQESAAEDPRRWLVERSTRDAETAGRLRDFADRLRTELQRAAAMTTWADLSSWCFELFGALVGSDVALQKLPAEEQYAAGTVVSLLRSLEGLDAIDDSASLAALRDILGLELAGSTQTVGRFGDGVLVAPLSAAVGLDVDVVYIVGLSEDLYPGRLRPDALLPERARAATEGELRSARELLHARYRHLLAALAVASQRTVASFPRGDLRRSSRRLPSRWLLPSLRDLSGNHELPATEWDAAYYGDRLTTAGSYAGELIQSGRLATEQEWRTRQAACASGLDDDAVVAAVELIRGRASAAFTRYDGNLIGADGLPDYARSDRAISPTALEKYAGCPHAFFVERMLGVQPLDQPEDIVLISPLEIGNLIHGSVEALVTECAYSLPGYGEPWSTAQHDTFMQIVQDRSEKLQRRGLTGHPRLWERERARILNDALAMLDEDNRWRAEVDAQVLASELAFGLHGRPSVQIPLPGGRVLMRGSADKVDRARDGRLFVTDIKTGSRRTFTDISQDEPVVAGTKLQLPVYGYAVRERYGDERSVVQAAYWFVRKNPGRVLLDLTPAVEQRYAETLSVLVGSIAAGLFPAKAPDVPDFLWVQCPYCNPDGIGHTDTRDRWERKRHDPALRELLALVEPDAVGEETAR